MLTAFIPALVVILCSYFSSIHIDSLEVELKKSQEAVSVCEVEKKSCEILIERDQEGAKAARCLFSCEDSACEERFQVCFTLVDTVKRSLKIKNNR
jgi:hypothetical protein